MAEKNLEKIVGDPLWDGEKIKIKSGEYNGSTPAFSAPHHAAQREVRVCIQSRIWTNRVRLPVLLLRLLVCACEFGLARQGRLVLNYEYIATRLRRATSFQW